MSLGKAALASFAVIVGLVLTAKAINQTSGNQIAPTKAALSLGDTSRATPAALTSSGTVASAPTPVTVHAAPLPEKEPIKLGAQWNYSHTDDAMGKGAVYFAKVTSSNTVSFSFPYAGEQHGHLALRTHPRFGKDVIFAIEKGQILCPSYDDCQVLVRFDDEPAAHYAGRGPQDNSSQSVFILAYDKFVGKLARAKRVRIAPNIYQQGGPVFEFDVEGFDSKNYRSAK